MCMAENMLSTIVFVQHLQIMRALVSFQITLPTFCF
jgi:hypothetical protein